MPDLPPNQDLEDDIARESHELDGPPATPRWVKVFGIIALIVVLALVVLMFTRGPGGHGPARHFSLNGPS